MVDVRILVGDCRRVMQTLPEKSVHCVVTSPPYFGLRDYGTGAWEGGDPECEHEASDRYYTERTAARASADAFSEPGEENRERLRKGRWRESGTCTRCGAVKIDSQIGLEKTPDDYVAELVAAFREVRRVLRDDGTVWLNLGDSYASGTTTARTAGSSAVGGWTSSANQINRNGKPPGLKTKDLLGIPWMVAFALRADGWYLRSDIIWDKTNPMPESVTDRPTKSHEYLFLLSKNERYFYDHEAIKEPAETDEGRPFGIERDRELGYDSKEAQLKKLRPSVKRGGFNGKSNALVGREAFRASSATRNKRDVWRVQTRPFLEAHFATFPPELITPAVLAGTSPQCCERCGKAWRRVLGDRLETGGNGSGNKERQHRIDFGGAPEHGGRQAHGVPWTPGDRPTIGWKAACKCVDAIGSGRCVVMDPFGGAGTTGLVTSRLDRNALLIELNPEYAYMAERRIRGEAPMFATVHVEEVAMSDEFARPPRGAPKVPDSTAPVVHPALEPETEGEGLHDRQPNAVPHGAPADTPLPDPRRPASGV